MNALKDRGVLDEGPALVANILECFFDQMISPLSTRQPKLPVRLNRWASARYISLAARHFQPPCVR